jgi:hypothetical protein
MRKARTSTLLPPHGVRALVPVVAASGGAGRSTVAGLLAQSFALATRTVLIDPAPRAVSPWADWLGVGMARPEAPGITALVGGRGLDTAAVQESSTRRTVPLGKVSKKELPATGIDAREGIGYDVLADTRPWTRPPVALPEDPRWYAQLVELGGWFAGVVDVGVPIVASHLAARAAVRQSLLDAWMRRADAVPVLVTAANGFGAAVLVRLISALEQDGVPTNRLVVAVANTAGTDAPRWMNTELAKLSGRIAALVEIPHDKAIRADGLARLDDVHEPTLEAVRKIGRVVANLVRHHASEEADEPYVFQLGSGPAPLADPGAATAERYYADAPKPPPQQEQQQQPATGWVPTRHRPGSGSA